MSDSAHITLSAAVGAAVSTAAILLYFRLVVRPNVARKTAVGLQENNQPPSAFPFVEDAKGDLWECIGGGMWTCPGDRHCDRTKPRADLTLPWRNVACWYGPVKWLRADEVATRRKSA